MNQIGKLLLWPAVLGLGLSVQGVTQNDRYNTIVDRNVFQLTSPPPPPPPPAPENEALSRSIELSGISTVDGQKKAWFVIKPKAGAKDLPTYVSLGESQEAEFLRVVSISEATGEVNVLNSGNAMVLSFKNNGTKPVAGAPIAPVVPGAPAASVIAQPHGGGAIAGGLSSGAIAGTPGGVGAVPAYGGRPVTVAGGLVPPTAPGNIAQTTDSGLRSIPSRQLRLSPIAAPQAQPEQPPLDPIRQRQVMEIQQSVFEAAGEPLPPLPPLVTPGGRNIPAPPGLPR